MTTDLAGNARFVGRVDLGPYEYATTAPELAPYRPTDWSDAVVATPVEGGTVDSLITVDDDVYVAVAFANMGSVSSGTFEANVELKDASGATLQTITFLGSSLEAGADDCWFASSESAARNFGKLAVGTYSLTLTLDAKGSVAEIDETNNVYTKTFTVRQRAESPSSVVTTNLDVVDRHDGFISLREAIAYVEADASLGSTLTFDASLKGQTIQLLGTQLEISQGLTIDASSLYDAESQTPGITIDGNQTSRVLQKGGSGNLEVTQIATFSLK